MRRPHRAHTFTAAALFACAALSGPAEAQTPAGTGATTTLGQASLEDLFKRFADAAKAGEWPKAYEAMQEAYSRKQTYDVLGNLGTAELELGKMRDAAEHLGHSLAIFPVVGKPEAKRVTEEKLAKALVHVGVIRLKVSPAQARVRVGARTYGADDYRDQVYVEAGEVTVSAGDVVGYVSQQKSVRVEKGKTVDVELALVATAATGTASASTSVTAAPTGAPSATGPNWGIVIAGGAVTLASLGVGIGLVAAAEGQKGEAVKLRQTLIDKKIFGLCQADTSDPDCQRFFDAGNLGQTLGNTGVPLLIGGGVIGLATVIYYVVARPRNPPQVSAAVSVGREGGGFSIHGKF